MCCIYLHFRLHVKTIGSNSSVLNEQGRARSQVRSRGLRARRGVRSRGLQATGERRPETRAVECAAADFGQRLASADLRRARSSAQPRIRATTGERRPETRAVVCAAADAGNDDDVRLNWRVGVCDRSAGKHSHTVPGSVSLLRQLTTDPGILERQACREDHAAL